jgi:hypothetical protein
MRGRKKDSTKVSFFFHVPSLVCDGVFVLSIFVWSVFFVPTIKWPFINFFYFFRFGVQKFREIINKPKIESLHVILLC